MRTYVNQIHEIFKYNWERDFLIEAKSGDHITYGELAQKSKQLASRLTEHGVKKADRVALIMPNRKESIFALFACFHIGATIVPIKPDLMVGEMEYIINHVEAVCIISNGEIDLAWIKDVSASTKLIVFNLSSNLSLGETSIFINEDSFNKSNVVYKREDVEFSNIKDDDIAVIAYTSGTTSNPKGVMKYYKNIIINSNTFSRFVRWNKDVRLLTILPLSHMTGWYNSIMIPFFTNATVILCEAFNAKSLITIWNDAEKYKVNTLWFVPTIISMLLRLDRGDHGSSYCKEHVNMVLCGAAPLNSVEKMLFEKKYSVPVLQNYGITETTFIAANSLDFPVRNNSVGKVLPGIVVNIVNEENNLCKAEETGDIYIKSPSLMAGYLKAEKGQDGISEQWGYRTNDIGKFDRDGYLYLTDRKSDLIIRGGINTSPKEIENYILQNYYVAEVAVVGLPHEIYGEEIAAFIKLKDNVECTEDQIINYCKKRLSNSKYPRKVIFLKELPKHLSGKIQKKNLREQYNNLFISNAYITS